MDVPRLVELCGSKLSKQEIFILMKKAKCHDQYLDYKPFVTAVEQILNDVKIDPY